MPIIDISRPLYPGTAVWPGDSPFQMDSVLTMSSGASVNLTTLSLSAHTGTHIDAPLHFSPDGEPVDRLDLRPYWGLARVVTVTKQHGPLLPADLPEVDFILAPRLLVRSVIGQPDYGHFPEAYVYPSPSLADFLAERGVVLFGSDAPSMDEEHSRALEGHHALRRRGIAILEWLDLSQAADGLYELTALPLKIMGGDGSPVRAALRPLQRQSG